MGNGLVFLGVEVIGVCIKSKRVCFESSEVWFIGN